MSGISRFIACSHRIGLVPGEEAGDAAIAVDHRLHLALARGRIGFEFEAFQAAALLDHVHEARIDGAGFAEQSAEFRDRVAQRGALLGPQPLVALAREAIADAGAEQRRAHGQHGEQHDQPRSREHALARARGCPTQKRAPGAFAAPLRY